ncbi:MAG: DNA repair protein RecO [Woeseiaceae bacterium]|jgi:DNA repair protein RecO (recombination protein O)|nr:DNA repair protein RecO [Woeseiaceae bacterium]|tara:strand:+ start:443 stop:1183 length:741 start_codon:yes stop_codon:yes gene_type:complete
MTAPKRVQNQPAWLLHHRPFRDTSRILDIISRDYGRLSLVARGSRSANSKLKGYLRPFLPVQMSWFIRSDLGTLTGAEMNGAPISLSGDALLSAYYINELLLNLLHKHDPQTDIFSAYQNTIETLNREADVAAVLRRFEMELLRLLGYGLNLDHDTESDAELDANRRYEYRIELGPVPVTGGEGPMIFTGTELIAIREQAFSDPLVLKNANRLLRQVIAWHLNGKELKSRKVLMEMRQSGSTQERK